MNWGEMAAAMQNSLICCSLKETQTQAVPLFKLPHHPTIINSSTTMSNSISRRRRRGGAVNNISACASASTPTPNTVVVDPTPIASAECGQGWSEFASNVSGEWDGYGADFTSEGKPIELPEFVVPQAYRDWDVMVFDWQTQCPTLAQSHDFHAMYKLIKLLPTVGCEADAATQYSVEERNILTGGGVDNNVAAFAYQSSGCYVAVWQISGEDGGTPRLLELEHCLVDPQNRESRVRIIQVVRVENCKLVLQNIKVFVEQWYGPFRNGEQLGGCAIRDSAFASTDVLKSSEVTGVWQGLNAVARFNTSQNNILQQLVDDSFQKSVRDECNLILLPKKLWCSLKEREDGGTSCEVGWLLDQGCALTSKCIFSSHAELKEIVAAYETAALA